MGASHLEHRDDNAMRFSSLWNSIERLGSLITLANWGIAATLLVAFACTVIAIKASSRKDELTGAEDLRKAEHIADLDHANLTLRGQVATLEINAANANRDLAGLQKAASDAKAAQQKVEIDLAKQQEKTAIAERALLELKERLAHRRINQSDHDKLVASLRPFRGSAVQLLKLGDEEAAQFADDLLAVLHDAEWSVQLSFAGSMAPPRYGLLCQVDESTPAGHALAVALRKLPTADVKPASLKPPVAANILVGLKPPA